VPWPMRPPQWPHGTGRRSESTGFVGSPLTIDKGAWVLVGGERVEGAGYYYRPTVLADVPLDARMQHERDLRSRSAGDLLATEDEAVAAANDTPYGLVAYVVYARPRAGSASLRAVAGRNDRAEPGHCFQSRRAVRRDQALGARSRGWPRRDRRVPGDEVRGSEYRLTQQQPSRGGVIRPSSDAPRVANVVRAPGSVLALGQSVGSAPGGAGHPPYGRR